MNTMGTVKLKDMLNETKKSRITEAIEEKKKVTLSINVSNDIISNIFNNYRAYKPQDKAEMILAEAIRESLKNTDMGEYINYRGGNAVVSYVHKQVYLTSELKHTPGTYKLPSEAMKFMDQIIKENAMNPIAPIKFNLDVKIIETRSFEFA